MPDVSISENIKNINDITLEDIILYQKMIKDIISNTYYLYPYCIDFKPDQDRSNSANNNVDVYAALIDFGLHTCIFSIKFPESPHTYKIDFSFAFLADYYQSYIELGKAVEDKDYNKIYQLMYYHSIEMFMKSMYSGKKGLLS